MGHVEVGHVSHVLPNGRVLLDDVSFRVGDGAVAALVGPNGAGKTTLLRLIAGDITPQGGTVSHSGGLGVMRQFIGGIRDSTNVYELLLSVAPPPIRKAAAAVQAAESVLMECDDEPAQLRYANALAAWGDAGGYEAENVWDACSVAALGIPYAQCQWRSGEHPVGRRAEATGVGGALARSRPGAVARRAGQLSRRARQAVAGVPATGNPEDGALGVA